MSEFRDLHWWFKTNHRGHFYTMEMEKSYKSGIVLKKEEAEEEKKKKNREERVAVFSEF